MAEITLGAIGHRHLHGTEKIMVGLENALVRILSTFPASRLRVLSCLAEGADRLLAARLLMFPNISMWVPLPLPQDDYLNDFESQASKEEFRLLLGKAKGVITMPPASSRELAYLAAGRYILENSDVLLAIWDGNSARGTAGTGDLITIARERSLPLAWIHASNHSKSSGQIAKENTAQGEVSFEHFPAPGKNL